MSIAPGARLVCGIAAADLEQFDALVEWVQAAGYEPVAAQPGGEPAAVVVVCWPCAGDFAAFGAPVVLLIDRHGDLPEAVRARAAEVVEQPDRHDVQSLMSWSKHLQGVLHRITAARRTSPAAAPVVLGGEELARGTPELIAIGVSTGGPEALKVLFTTLRGQSLPPMVIVQHMPAAFVGQLAERLQAIGACAMAVATHGAVLAAGTAYFAPGDRHLRVIGRENGQLVAHLTDEAPVRGHRPAVEILFESCCELPVRGIGVLMTGMGQDGARGLLALRRKGWATLAQDAASCAIHGMPLAAKALGAVERELPLEDIGRWLAMLCRSPRGTAARSRVTAPAAAAADPRRGSRP